MKRRRSRHASLSGGRSWDLTLGPWILSGVPHRFSGDQQDDLPLGGEGTVCVPMIAGLTEQQARWGSWSSKKLPKLGFSTGKVLGCFGCFGYFWWRRICIPVWDSQFYSMPPCPLPHVFRSDVSLPGSRSAGSL